MCFRILIHDMHKKDLLKPLFLEVRQMWQFPLWVNLRIFLVLARATMITNNPIMVVVPDCWVVGESGRDRHFKFLGCYFRADAEIERKDDTLVVRQVMDEVEKIGGTDWTSDGT